MTENPDLSPNPPPLCRGMLLISFFHLVDFSWVQLALQLTSRQGDSADLSLSSSLLGMISPSVGKTDLGLLYTLMADEGGQKPSKPVWPLKAEILDQCRSFSLEVNEALVDKMAFGLSMLKGGQPLLMYGPTMCGKSSASKVITLSFPKLVPAAERPPSRLIVF